MEAVMATKKPKKGGQPGTTDQWPTWEGAPESRPPGYLPAEDDPERNPDAAGETLSNPDKRDLGDAFATRGGDDERRISQRAHEIWEREGRPSGAQDRHWHQARAEIEAEQRLSGDKLP
jgi:hypothetical protein